MGACVSDAAEVTPEQAAQLAEPGARPYVTTVRTLRLVESAWEYLQYTLAGSASDETELCRRLHTDARHIACSKLSADPFQPAHYVHVDDAHRRLVLCIRGSQELADIVTDIAALPLPLPSLRHLGAVHGGFLAAAVALVRTVKPLLLALKRQHPAYAVRVVGHSLGAGVAVPFTLLVRAELPCARAVVFGVPACVTESLVPGTLECVTSFVNRNDPLPSVSPHVIGPIINTIIDTLIGFVPGLLSSIRFVPPGKLFCLCGDDDDASAASSSPVYTRLKPVNYSFFKDLVVRSRPISSHVCDGYEASFSALRHALRDRLCRLEASGSF